MDTKAPNYGINDWKRFKSSSEDREMYDRYLGTLGLLAEVSVYLPSDDEGEEMRQQIIRAFDDAQENHPVRWRRILNRIEIFPYDHGPSI